jgi:hypothetical protein
MAFTRSSRCRWGPVRFAVDVRSQLPYAELAEDEHRNRLIADLHSAARNVIVLRGGMTPAERRAAAVTLASIPDGDSRLLIATGRYIGEGSTTRGSVRSVDREVPMLARMFKKRLRGYHAIGYDRDSGTLPKRELADALDTSDIREVSDGDEQET